MAICSGVVMNCHQAEMSGNIQHCAPQKRPASAAIGRANMAGPFIDHSNGMWNFRANRSLDPPANTSPGSMRKVKL
jgi:hypothetical protein